MRQLIICFAGICLFAIASSGHAQETQPPEPPAAPAMGAAPANEAQAEPPAPAETQTAEPSEEEPEENHDAPPMMAMPGGQHDGNEVVSVGHDAHLEKDSKADTVVAVFGSATSEGDVSDAVVSVFGDTRVTGSVGDAAVAVAGDVYVNSHVHGDVVAVLGNVELGPMAEVGGQLVVIGGMLKRDPAAVVHGGTEQILTGILGNFRWLRPWIEHCLLLGRPLAIAPGLGWAWGLALGFLAFYVLLAVLFREPLEQCARTLETHPGQSALAALLALLLTPVLIVLLCITLVGVVALPFLGLAIFGATLFGKAVVLATIGRRITNLAPASGPAQAAIAVLIGGLIMLAFYLVPFVGFILFKLLGILGLGVVVYTLLLVAKQRRAAIPRPAPRDPAAAAASVAAAPGAGLNGPQSSGEMGSAAAPSSSSTASAPAMSDLDASTLPRAGFWIRMGALTLDAILIGIITSLFGRDSHESGMLILLAVYGAVMWRFKGTTVGGIICGLKVVRVDGRVVDWPTAVVRALSCFLSLAVVGLGFLWILFDDDRQAWHDKIAGTAVVRVPKGVSLL